MPAIGLDSPSDALVETVDELGSEPDDELMLGAVGLGDSDESVYAALVENSPSRVDSLGVVTGLDSGQLTAALRTLEDKGLVQRLPGDPARYSAVAPELALETLIADQEDRLRRARVVAAQFASRFRATAGRREPSEVVELVHGRDAVADRIHRLQHSARREVRWIDKPPYVGPPTTTSQVESDQLDRGVRYRVVYDTGALGHHELRGDIEATIRRGEEARLLSSTPVKMALIDDRYACLPLAAAPDEIATAVVVHPSGLLEALSALFEELWDRALPLSPNLTTKPSSISIDDRRLIALLTAGIPDSKAAKQLGVSPRTYQRRIQMLMNRLGVATRFQAGLQVTLLGWTTRSRDPDSGAF